MKIHDIDWWDRDGKSTAMVEDAELGGRAIGHVGSLFGHPVFTIYLPPPEMPLDEMKRRFVAAMDAALREEPGAARKHYGKLPPKHEPFAEGEPWHYPKLPMGDDGEPET